MQSFQILWQVEIEQYFDLGLESVLTRACFCPKQVESLCISGPVRAALLALRGSDFRSKCIRRSQFFRRNCIPSLNLIEMHGSSGGSDLSALEHKMQRAPKPIRWDRRNPSQPLISPIWEKCSHALICINFAPKTFHPDQFLFPVSNWWWPVWCILLFSGWPPQWMWE